jgi:hypothetical protein
MQKAQPASKVGLRKLASIIPELRAVPPRRAGQPRPGSCLLDELRLQRHRAYAVDLAVDVVVAIDWLLDLGSNQGPTD